MTLKGRLAIFTLICAVFALVASCTIAPKKKQPVKAAPSVQDSLAKVQIDIAAGAHDRAVGKLKKIVGDHPDTDVADDAYMMMGQIYFQKRDFRNSYESYMSVVNSDVFSPREADALLGAAKSLARTGSYD
ncbi:MAG: hypothetical protein KDD43_11300, partial [Bdellovibrionales bacterium]|nr:hypothetical protein [Bdellovibrionales bacterium]